MTLAQWQHTIKPEDELIVQPSTIDCPDGITNTTIGMSYHYCQFKKTDIESLQIGNHQQLVLCSISTDTDGSRRKYTNRNRRIFVDTLSRNDIINENIDAFEYFKRLPDYKFVISPEGNGIDCHRHYEALLAGCIPVVERNPVLVDKYGSNIPFLYTDDYTEVTLDYLHSKYDKMLNTSYDFRPLFLSFWNSQEQLEIKKRGNYWCVRIVGQKWYN